MNANRLIKMVFRMVLRKGMARIGRSGPQDANSKAARTASKRARQAARLTRRL